MMSRYLLCSCGRAALAPYPHPEAAPDVCRSCKQPMEQAAMSIEVATGPPSPDLERVIQTILLGHPADMTHGYVFIADPGAWPLTWEEFKRQSFDINTDTD